MEKWRRTDTGCELKLRTNMSNRMMHCIISSAWQQKRISRSYKAKLQEIYNFKKAQSIHFKSSSDKGFFTGQNTVKIPSGVFPC